MTKGIYFGVLGSIKGIYLFYSFHLNFDTLPNKPPPNISKRKVNELITFSAWSDLLQGSHEREKNNKVCTRVHV